MVSIEYILLDISCYTEESLRALWHEHYVSKQIYTHDGIEVSFFDSNFDHAFFESSGRNVSKRNKLHKNILSKQRLQRMLWIKDVLRDKNAKMVVGYDSKERKYDKNKRVAIVKDNYVVVIQFCKKDRKHAIFITAYVADVSIEKILQSPSWEE